MQSDYAWPAISFVALAALSIVADRWRHNRREADRAQLRTAWVPWPLITISSLIAAAYCAALWLHSV